jgi:rubrerythrin
MKRTLSLHCHNCGRNYTAKRKSSKFCSDTCRVEYNRYGAPKHVLEYRSAIHHLSEFLRLVELNPHWQADSKIIDAAQQISSFATDIDSQYEAGVQHFKANDNIHEIRPSEFTQKDTERYAYHLLSFHDRYKCLACGQTVTGKRTNKDNCAFCGENKKWIRIPAVSG